MDLAYVSMSYMLRVHMKIVFCIGCSLLAIGLTGCGESRIAEKPSLNVEEKQNIRAEYDNRIKARRLAEAQVIWPLVTRGETETELEVYLTFHIIGTEKNVSDTENQLSEYYAIKVKPTNSDSIFQLIGTTKPESVSVNRDTHFEWVAFIADVAAQYGATLLYWEVEKVSGGEVFTTENIDLDMP